MFHVLALTSRRSLFLDESSMPVNGTLPEGFGTFQRTALAN